MLELRTPTEVDAMREAGRVVGRILEAVRAHAAPGVSLLELDTLAADLLADAGATSPFLGYAPHGAPPFPGRLCLSVDDAVLHGIPTRYRLRAGDLLSADCGATLDGWVGDAAVSFVVGQVRRPDAEAVVGATVTALAAGIAAAVPGNRIGDISAAIAEVGHAAGCGIDTAMGGHGVGRSMHEAPSVPNDGRPGRGLRLRAGLVIAIEPWFTAGGIDDHRVDDDGWTVRSVDGSLGSHSEHTVAVTDAGPRILTLP